MEDFLDSPTSAKKLLAHRAFFFKDGIMKSSKKPVGTNGPVSISENEIEFQKLEYPKSKEAIEIAIVRSFADGNIPGGLQISSFYQQDQNDFDFKVESNCGDLYLELMEIAPLEHLHGSYANAPSEYKPYDFSKYIFDKAMGKSTRYGGSKVPRIVLLLYITDWAFVLSDSVICLLQFWMQNQAHSFLKVFVHQPIQEGFGISHLIYPTPGVHWRKFDPESLKDNLVKNISPVQWKHI